MEEMIKKEDGFTAWRAKINRVFGSLSWLLSGTREKSYLASENGKVEWKAVENPKPEERLESLSSLRVDGILNAESLAVSGAAKFLCQLDADAGLSASSISVKDSLVLGGSGSTAKIGLQGDGVAIGPAVFKEREVDLPPLTKIGGASIGLSRGVLTFYGKASPCKMDVDNGGAEFPYGLSGKEVVFPSGRIDGYNYTGNAESATRLRDAVSVFGCAFDGTKDVTGKIDGCTGLTLEEGAEISFKGTVGNGALTVSNGVMEWSGSFHPQRIVSDAEQYCEWYPSRERLLPGDVITLDAKAASETYVKVRDEDKMPLAVVAEGYSICIGTKTPESYPACNKGRVKAKVEGKVSIGTRLVASSTAGALRPATSKEKHPWAVALEASDNENVKLVKVHIL